VGILLVSQCMDPDTTTLSVLFALYFAFESSCGTFRLRKLTIERFRGIKCNEKTGTTEWLLHSSSCLWCMLQIVQGLINELEAQGALPRSNSRVSSLATCCGQRYRFPNFSKLLFSNRQAFLFDCVEELFECTWHLSWVKKILSSSKWGKMFSLFFVLVRKILFTFKIIVWRRTSSSH
jgi:hypothetical protein